MIAQLKDLPPNIVYGLPRQILVLSELDVGSEDIVTRVSGISSAKM